MRVVDTVHFAVTAFIGYRTRSLLLLLAMAIGVGSVVVLSTLGEGARSFVVGQFSSLGTNLLMVLPGRSETVGGPPPMLGVTPRDLTVEDAEALLHFSSIRYVAPVVVGAVSVSKGSREREVIILGSTEHLFKIRQLSMAHGRFLPSSNSGKSSAVCVLGQETKEELFGKERALGEMVKIGDRRFRVIGVLGAKGQSMGMDMSDVVVIPVASALSVFDTNSLFRIMVEAVSREAMPRAKKSILQTIQLRHDGEDDITVITQDAVLATFDKIFLVLTLAVTGIGAISIGVAGILIMNVMLIAVSQRRSEVGLLKALGATGGQIITLFLAEAAILSLLGGIFGLILAFGGVWGIEKMLPNFPLQIPIWAMVLGMAVALLTGMVFGVLPALRASRLDPVVSLSRR